MAYMTPDENDWFKLLCDEIMRTTQPDIVAALQAWFRGNAEGLPVVMTEITTTLGRTTVVSRDEIEPGDPDRDAMIEAINGPRDLIPVILYFKEIGFTHCLWIQPLSGQEN